MVDADLAETDGGVKPARQLRRTFSLPQEDVEVLDASELPWETIIDNGTRWLLIHDWMLPHGFTTPSATVAVRIVPGYPSAALDMIYVHPRLARTDGRSIGGLSDTVIDGRTFQQWSRHYSPQNPWRSDIDCIATHLRVVAAWFAKAVS